jgi:rRNA-processing protein FCF1
MSKKVFIDTMVFLHYRSIDEIDLPKILDAKSVTIVIPRITLRELDDHKNEHKLPKIRDRAKRIQTKMLDWIENEKPVRQGVSIHNYHKVPFLDCYQKYGLKSDWNDDILIASIIQFKEETPGKEVILITQDAGPRLTANQFNIPVISLSEEYKLPIEPNPVEKENKRLKEELAKIKGAQPKLVLCFSGSNKEENFKKFVIGPPLESEEDQIKKIISNIKKKLPKIFPPQKEGPRIDFLKDVSVFIDPLYEIPLKEYDRYNKGLENFFIKYENFLQKKWEVRDRERRTILLELVVKNIGSAPADNVDLYLHFPDGFQLSVANSQPQPPIKPCLPRKPRTKFQMNLYPVDPPRELSSLPNFSILDRVSDFGTAPSYKIKRTNSYKFTQEFDRIKHGDSVKLPELFLVFDSFEAAKSFNCDYTFSVANLPEPIEGRLNFIIERSI